MRAGHRPTTSLSVHLGQKPPLPVPAFSFPTRNDDLAKRPGLIGWCRRQEETA